MLEAITQKVDSNAVGHPNGTKVAGTFADRPLTPMMEPVSAKPYAALAV